MGKNIKSYATTQVHFPREREGSLMAKGPNISFTIWYGLTIHIIRFKITTKFSKLSSPVKFQRIMQIPRSSLPHSPRILQNSHYPINLLYTMFQPPFQAENPAEFQRIVQIPRNSPAQSANYAKFAHFVNLFYIMFQAPAPAKNFQKFQRIMQIPRSSPT